MARKFGEDGTLTFETRLEKGGDKHSTVATLDWTGVTEDKLREYATRGVVIDVQAIYRKAEHVPATDTIKVADIMNRARGGGFKFTPASAVKKINELDDDAYRATLTGLGLNRDQVERMVKNRKKAGEVSGTGK